MSGKWSGLPDHETEELARLAMYAICEEWDPSDPGLPSSVVYERLVAEGVEVPDGAMADALDRLEGWLIEPYIGRRPPYDEAGMAEFRRHGAMTIGRVNRDFCE